MLSNRDYRWTNELLVKMAFLTLLFDDWLYMMVSETEVDHGYADLALIVRPDMRRFPALDLLLEFKYVSLQDLKLTGEQVREKTPGELAACLWSRRSWARPGNRPSGTAKSCGNAMACATRAPSQWSRWAWSG